MAGAGCCRAAGACAGLALLRPLLRRGTRRRGGRRLIVRRGQRGCRVRLPSFLPASDAAGGAGVSTTGAGAEGDARSVSRGRAAWAGAAASGRWVDAGRPTRRLAPRLARPPLALDRRRPEGLGGLAVEIDLGLARQRQLRRPLAADRARRHEGFAAPAPISEPLDRRPLLGFLVVRRVIPRTQPAARARRRKLHGRAARAQEAAAIGVDDETHAGAVLVDRLNNIDVAGEARHREPGEAVSRGDAGSRPRRHRILREQLRRDRCRSEKRRRNEPRHQDPPRAPYG